MNVYNLNEITDSNIQYNKKPPVLMYYVVLIVMALLIGGLIWANKSVKTYIVKGQGIVVTENKSHIMTKGSGEVTEVFIEEGSEVKVGDILFTTSGLEADLQLEQINAQIEKYNARIALLKQAEENATNGTNYFDRNDEIQSEFYNKLTAAYLARKEFEVDVEALKKDAIKQVEKELATQIDSKIDSGEAIEPKIEDDGEIEPENNEEINGSNKEDIEAKKEEMLQEQMAQIDDYVKTQKNKSDEHYFKTISEFINERKQYEAEVSKLVSQKDSYEKSKEQYIVTAQSDGVVHLNTPLTVGMVIQSGNLIGTVNNKEENMIVETMLPSTDRPRIHVGDEVSLVVGGLNQAEYGTIPGNVVSIDEDATIDNENGNIYFKVKVKPDRIYLEDSKGERVNLTVGMVTETRVKYEKITYMKYFLELIGAKFS